MKLKPALPRQQKHQRTGAAHPIAPRDRDPRDVTAANGGKRATRRSAHHKHGKPGAKPVARGGRFHS